jgi:hypothetical protein
MGATGATGPAATLSGSNDYFLYKTGTSTADTSNLMFKDTFGINIRDSTIHDILTRYRITRKRLRSKYYPEKREGQEKQDLESLTQEDIDKLLSENI